MAAEENAQRYRGSGGGELEAGDSRGAEEDEEEEDDEEEEEALVAQMEANLAKLGFSDREVIEYLGALTADDAEAGLAGGKGAGAAGRGSTAQRR